MHDSCQSEVTKPAGLGKSVKKEEGAGVLHWGGGRLRWWGEELVQPISTAVLQGHI